MAKVNFSPDNMHLLVGASIADVLRASSELHIEELLAEQAWTTPALAVHTETEPRWLEAILRGLANLGLIRRVEVERVGSLWSTNRS